MKKQKKMLDKQFGRRFIKAFLRDRWTLIYATLFAISAGILGDVAKGEIVLSNWYEGAGTVRESFGAWFLTTVVIVLVALFFGHLANQRIREINPIELNPDAIVGKHKVLVLPLTKIGLDPKINEENGSKCLSLANKTELDFPLPKTIQELRDQLLGQPETSNWNGLQIVRLLAEFESDPESRRALDLIRLLPSGGKDSSRKSCPVITALIEHYFCCAVETSRAELETERVLKNYALFKSEIAYLTDERDYAYEDIVIDITGMTKPVSIAGAFATMNSQITFSYVPTADKDAKPEAFNIGYPDVDTD